MASSYQDLIDALFNPYASEIMQAYGYTPSAGTPSITDPGTYVDTGGTGPGAYIPPSGTPGAIFPGSGTVSGGTVGGGTVGGGTVGGGTVGGGTVGGGTVGGGTVGGGTVGGGTVGGGTVGGGTVGDGTVGGGTVGGGTVSGGTPYEGPYNQSPEYLAMIEADIQNTYGGDRFLHSKRGLVGGEQLGPRQTYSLEEFTSGILPYAKGMYGSGVTYDPKTGLMYNNITQEELARRRRTQKYARIFGVHPDALTDREKQLIKLGGHGEMSPGTKYIRIGGPTSGTHYFIENGQVYAYDYKAGDTLGFGGMGPKYGENNFQLTPVEFDQWIDDLKPSASESTSGADTAQAEQKEVGPSLASELVMEAEEMPPQLTVAAPSTRKEVPADANTMGQFNFQSPSEMLQSNFDAFRNMTAEELIEMNRGRVPPPRISSAVPAAPAGLMGNIGLSPPGVLSTSPMASAQPMRREPPAGPRTIIEPTPTVPTTTVLPPQGITRPDTSRLSFEDFRAPVPATPAPPAPEFTPEQRAAINQALGAISSGGGFRLPFKNGGPVTSGIGGLFRKEVMR